MKKNRLQLILTLLICLVTPAFAKTSDSKRELRGEYFIKCESNTKGTSQNWEKCDIDDIDYRMLETLGFEGAEGEYEMTREDVDIASNTEWECLTIVFNFKSAKAADAFMKTFDDLWKDTNGVKLQNRKSAGLSKKDLCVDRTDNMVWLGYLYMFQD